MAMDMMEFVREQFGRWVPDAAPQGIRILRRGKIAFVTVRCDDGDRRLVIKNVADDANRKQPSQILDIVRYVQSENPGLAANMPKILGADDARAWLVMEYVPGRTLESAMKAWLFWRWGRPEEIRTSLVEIAHVLLAMKQIRLPEAERASTQWSSAKTIEEFERTVGDSDMKPFLPKDAGAIRVLLNRFGGQCQVASGESLVPVDCQPKNVLVQRGGRVCLIDPDYSVAHPVLAVAHFLVSLDRLGLVHPSRTSRAIIAGWKREFLSAYRTGTDPSFAEALIVLYPSVLARTCRWHGACRPWLRRYLYWYYGGRLREFLSLLIDVPVNQLVESPAELFRDP